VFFNMKYKAIAVDESFPEYIVKKNIKRLDYMKLFEINTTYYE